MILGEARIEEGLRVYAIGDIHGCLEQLTALHGLIARDVAQRPVLSGLDPVRLIEGRDVRGLESLWVDRGSYRYVFESAATRQQFLADPERYEIQLGGACAFMAGSNTWSRCQ